MKYGEEREEADGEGAAGADGDEIADLSAIAQNGLLEDGEDAGLLEGEAELKGEGEVSANDGVDSEDDLDNG